MTRGINLLCWVVSLESNYAFQASPYSLITLCTHTRECIASSSKVTTRGAHRRVHLSAYFFHRTLCTFTTTLPNMTGENLDHPYVARVELTHGTLLPVREQWEEVVQKQAAVGEVPPGPGCEEDDPLTPATRFLWHLEEDFLPSHFNFTVDSDKDYLFPHSPSQTIAHTLRLGNLQPSFTPITQISTLPEERDPNDDTPTPDLPAPEFLLSQQLLHGASLERWLEADPHLDPVVLRLFDSTECILGKYKRQREEPEQEEAP